MTTNPNPTTERHTMKDDRLYKISIVDVNDACHLWSARGYWAALDKLAALEAKGRVTYSGREIPIRPGRGSVSPW